MQCKIEEPYRGAAADVDRLPVVGEASVGTLALALHGQG